MKYKKERRFKPNLCNGAMTFEDCEIAILRNAVDESDKIKGEKNVNNEEVKKILTIVEHFIRQKKLILYGGTAINNILPNSAKFYNKDIELPDYDMYSKNALEDAKELADIYYKEGYLDVEAKSGVHVGTYKVFVNFMPIADITDLNSQIYKEILKDSITVNGMKHSPPDFLRMNMYLELSRPQGDVSRWEKVLKRLSLLNQHFPLKIESNCKTIDFQRGLDSINICSSKSVTNNRECESIKNLSERLYIVTRDILINQEVVFFGGYAASLYSRYMPEHEKHQVNKIPDFDVLSDEPEKCAEIVKEQLLDSGFKKIKLVNHPAIGETIPEHVEIIVSNETIAFIYKPIACHSYNKLHIDGKDIHIATIDTILTFYLAFIYTGEPEHIRERLLCMAKYLFEIEEKNRLEQRGLLKRFSLECYGKQQTLEEIRSEKALKYKELSGKRGTKEYDMWFLKYIPGAKVNGAKVKKMKTEKIRSSKNKTRRTDNKKTEDNGYFF